MCVSLHGSKCLVDVNGCRCSQACKYITDHSEAEVVVVENKMQLDKYVKVKKSVTCQRGS